MFSLWSNLLARAYYCSDRSAPDGRCQIREMSNLRRSVVGHTGTKAIEGKDPNVSRLADVGAI